MEVWKTVLDAPNYEISKSGLVRNKNTKLILKQRNSEGDSPKVTISKNGHPVTLYVHRMVAEAFNRRPEGKRIVIHKNGNKQDNTSKNLVWTDYSDLFTEAIRESISERMIGNQNAKKE